MSNASKTIHPVTLNYSRTLDWTQYVTNTKFKKLNFVLFYNLQSNFKSVYRKTIAHHKHIKR